MKKGVTNIILAIGVILVIVIVLYAGIRLLLPIISVEPEFLAKDLAFTMDAALAAPENLDLKYTFPEVRKRVASLGVVEAPYACAGTIEFDVWDALLSALSPAGFLLSSDFTLSKDRAEVEISGTTVEVVCKTFTKGGAAIDKASFVNTIILQKTYADGKNKVKWK